MPQSRGPSIGRLLFALAALPAASAQERAAHLTLELRDAETRDAVLDARCGLVDPASGEVEGAKEAGIELSPEKLSPAALRGLVEEFVSREGTDYGHADTSSQIEALRLIRENGSIDSRVVDRILDNNARALYGLD